MKAKNGGQTAKGHIEVRWLRRTHTGTLNREHECRVSDSEEAERVEQVVFVFVRSSSRQVLRRISSS